MRRKRAERVPRGSFPNTGPARSDGVRLESRGRRPSASTVDADQAPVEHGAASRGSPELTLGGRSRDPAQGRVRASEGCRRERGEVRLAWDELRCAAGHGRAENAGLEVEDAPILARVLVPEEAAAADEEDGVDLSGGTEVVAEAAVEVVDIDATAAVGDDHAVSADVAGPAL